MLIIGAMSTIRAVIRKGGAPEESWRARRLERKPGKLVGIALADKMARGIRAMMSKQEDYRNPAIAAA